MCGGPKDEKQEKDRDDRQDGPTDLRRRSSTENLGNHLYVHTYEWYTLIGELREG